MFKVGCMRIDMCGVDNDIVYIVKILMVDDVGDSGWFIMCCFEVVVGMWLGWFRGVVVELEGLEKDGVLLYWCSCFDFCLCLNVRCGWCVKDLVDG